MMVCSRDGSGIASKFLGGRMTWDMADGLGGVQIYLEQLCE